MTVDTFNEILWENARRLYRDMPWREDTRPYYVLVSELMLQQTQVDRVIPKFEAFVEAFPDEESLVNASLADVLRLWQGLGYNRRAKFLHEAAKSITSHGSFPDDEPGLLALPGVGVNTAGAIRAYAYNQPALFIETNVRAVYIHHFFDDQELIDDKQIREKLEQTIDNEHPREFYWALMDYGSWLKKQGVLPSRSKHYKKQAPLKGSIRQVRGRIIAVLSGADSTETALRTTFGEDERFQPALAGLIKDGLVVVNGHNIHLTK